MSDTLDQLIRARALIEDEAFWNQGLREDSFGLSHCAFGALNYIISKDKRSDVDASHPTLIALLAVIRQTAKNIPEMIIEDHAPFNLMWFNDNHSHTEVLALFDRAIERQRLIEGLGGLPVSYLDDVTEEQVRKIDDLVREEFESGEWVTVEEPVA